MLVEVDFARAGDGGSILCLYRTTIFGSYLFIPFFSPQLTNVTWNTATAHLHSSDVKGLGCFRRFVELSTDCSRSPGAPVNDVFPSAAAVRPLQHAKMGFNEQI